LSEVYRALADPTRRRILQLLRDRAMTAGELADEFALAKPTMSGHFAVLRNAGLIHAEKERTTITYRLNVSVLEEALLALMDGFRLGERPAPGQMKETIS
jgi:ArsR family transcriptional regulator, arsenate/arsenite/antimonite-responsive transcriptional repressor